jgi:primase-polymerase (primpol)-like protein
MNNLATPKADNLPPELRDQARWVVARIEDRDGKATKVPFRPLDPTRRADTTDPSTWSDFTTTRQLVESGTFPMLGFVLGSGFVGVDLDQCRNTETGAVEPWAEDIVRLLDSYTEWSVSGTGIHIICRGVLPAGRRRKGRIEMYESARYFVMTGHGATKAVADRTAQLAALHANIFGSAGQLAPAQAAPQRLENWPVQGAVANLSDDDLLAIAGSASNGAKFRRLWCGDTSKHGSRSEADLALCCHLAFYTQADSARIDRLFRRSRLYRSKWDRVDYRARTIARAIAGTPDVYEPAVDIPELPLDPDAPPITIDLDTANLGAL